MHIYFSTACIHGEHAYCRCDVSLTGQPKVAGKCKFCDERCVCECHQGVSDGQDEVRDGPDV